MTQLVVHHDCDSVIPGGLLFESCKPFLKFQVEIGTNSRRERKKHLHFTADERVLQKYMVFLCRSRRWCVLQWPSQHPPENVQCVNKRVVFALPHFLLANFLATNKTR